MIKKQILASNLLLSTYDTDIIEVSHSGLSRLDINSMFKLIDILEQMGISSKDAFMCIDLNRPAACVFAGVSTNQDIFEVLETNLTENFELYRLDDRLCADLYTVAANHIRRLRHVEILRMTPRGVRIAMDNMNRSAYSPEELALLLCKSPDLTVFPFINAERGDL